ncbi:MAG: hypothetical protein L0Y56_08680, partial [Nitrospira sp.]|nr:hypothetical protein [Nitrospira sp.]
MPTLIGVYRDNSEVQKVIRDLRMAGISDEAINLIGSVKDRYLDRLDRDKSSRSPSGAIAMNAVLGGMIGSFAGLTLGFFFPIIEPILVGLGGAILGAIAGVVLTILFKWGISDGHLASQIGFAQVEVETPEDRKEQVTEIMEKYDPISMGERANRRQSQSQENKDSGQSSEVSPGLTGPGKPSEEPSTQAGDSPSSENERRPPGETRSGDIVAVRESIYYDPDPVDDAGASNYRFPDYEFYLSDFRQHFEQH